MINSLVSNEVKAALAAEIGNGASIAIDAEWDSKRKLVIGYALVIEAKYIFVVLNEAIKGRNDVPETVIERLENHCQERGWFLHWMPLNDDSCDATSRLLWQYDINKGSFDVLLYYSPKDLRVSFGTKNLEPYFNKGKITQKRRLAGTYKNDKLKYTICDLKGWSNTSLKQFAASVGVEMLSKDEMNDYKTRMLDGLVAKPEIFLNYMVGDTVSLFEIREKFVENIQWLQRDVIKLPEPAVDTIPLTIGSIVAGTLEKYIRYCLCPERQFELEYAFFKLGIINADARGKEEVTALHHELRQKITDSQTFADNQSEATKLIQIHRKKYQFEAFSQCSVKYLGRETKTTEAFLALVQGGRCNNEQYWRYRLDYAADIDLKSAYASVLRRIEYPIGLPTITSFTPNEPHWTLSEWFERSKVIQSQSRNWMVVVEGSLSFAQDLLYSKATTQRKINKAVISATEDDTRDNDSDSHIPGHFILARHELENAVITGDLWETLEKVATSRELKELRNLKVVAAAYYSDEDKCTDVNEWIDKILADSCEYVTDKKTGRIIDKRTRAWFSLPLEEVFGLIIDKRNEVKSQAKQAKAEGRDEEYLKLKGKQEALKLFVNTGYGVLASPYFKIGNTVVANNITAAIRLAVWQMSKALNTCQSITDGGMYEPGSVNRLKTNVDSFRKPSLATLSNLRDLQESRNIKIGSLGDIDWESLLERMFQNELTPEDEKILKQHDASALRHIEEFWQVYDLDFQFDVEHKTENYALRVAYWSKADYALDRVDGERYYKIRGAKKNANLKNHPKFELFDNILALDDTFPKDLNYNFRCLLKVGKFKVIQNSKGYENHKTLQPGDDYEESRTVQFNNTHMPVDTVKEYEKRDKRSKKPDKMLFEKYALKGIKYLHAMMMLDNLSGRNT